MLLAENALTQPYFEQKILVLITADHIVKDVNLETIIDTLSWYKIWQLNEFNLIRAKQKLLGKRNRAYKSSWSRRGNQESFTLTIP